MELLIKCPHCDFEILIAADDINCGIFRHGILKSNGDQINPHETQEICDKLFNEGLIRGCGKPFQIRKEINNFIVSICDYI